jgi:hypothetical protein
LTEVPPQVEAVIEGVAREAEAEATESVAEAAIAVAEIEAARDIAVAEIHAETEQVRIATDAENREDIVWLRETLALTETRLAEVTAERDTLLNLATVEPEPIVSGPLPLETMTQEEIAETISPSTLNDTSAEIEQTLTEAIVESDAEKTELLDLPPALSVPKRGPIIRLV